PPRHPLSLHDALPISTTTLTGLSYPNALVFDGSGNLYVANYGGTTVSKFAPGALTPTATLTGLNAPYNLNVDGSGNLYVANVNGDRKSTRLNSSHVAI